MTQTVLISGAGVAGPTLAYWLARHGFRPTVVERAQGTRSSGNPVDVRGPALPVARGMGVLPGLRASATRATAMRAVDAAGRTLARLPMSRNADDVEIPRADLARVLYEAARDHAEFRFDDTVTSLSQDAGGVDVTFDRAPARRFDLVVGADGLHSAVRRLAFPAAAVRVEHLGVYVGTLPVVADEDPDVLLYNEPGRLASLHPSRERSLAAFIYRAPAVPGFDHRDAAQHRRLLHSAYAGAGWRVPALLEQVETTDELYFDAVCRVRMPTWSAGRITLLGDAASCVSLFGEGSSLAMAGAYTLASALASAPDVATALRRYEAEHRALTGPRQRHAGRAATLLIPKTRLGIAARNVAARTLSRAA
ncbi:FAD-dependent monooxygenase [Dactylosporangium sp. NPDC005572]|uniref:FAD-dependent monooxygenase n=1 Tax=Dactylosporangium sp. NPDC005572 TaxID=3156889 RepID=UPI0033BADE64